MAEPQFWSSDVAISLPRPSAYQSMVPMQGFTITAAGLMHDITEADHARLSTPNFAPANFGLETVYEDADLEAPPSDMEVF